MNAGEKEKALRAVSNASGAGPTYVVTRGIFLRALAVIYLVAIASLGIQINALVGPDGILPAGDFLQHVRKTFSANPVWQAPTLCWISAGSGMLYGLCVAGFVAALMLFAGILQGPMLAVMWCTYLSLTVAGQVFFSFQWDTLLLETCFVAMFWAPWRLHSGHPDVPAPGRAGLWLLRGLLFKLMFLSGVTKLLSGDIPWHEGTALVHHFETQPLPNWLAWYVHQLAPPWHEVSTWIMYFIEIVVPFAIVGPRWMRVGGFSLLVLLQGMIAATGSYCFFNLLAIMLCLPMLDDVVWHRGFARRFVASSSPARPPRHGWRLLALAPAGGVALASAISFADEMVTTNTMRQRAMNAGQDRKAIPALVSTMLEATDRGILQWVRPGATQWLRPWRTINGYGLFRTMTTRRPEIEIEGSMDGRQWTGYPFPWKPGPGNRRPRYAAPHQPRLDWQMWFAALNPRGAYWLEPLALRLMEGSPPVIGLFPKNPFPDSPPRYIRFVFYEYRFSRWDEPTDRGLWWRRQRLGATNPIRQPAP